MPNRKKIAFVVNSLVGGGAERAVVNILAGSQTWNDTYDICLFVLDADQEAYDPPAFIDTRRLDGRMSLPHSMRVLRTALQEFLPDLVISALSRANVSNVAISKLTGHRTILCEHNFTSGKHKGLSGKLAMALVRLAYPRADKVIGVSQGICDDLVENFGVRRDRVVAIANPVDVEAIRRKGDEPLGLEIDTPYLLGMGRFATHKNYAMLIEAFAASRFPGPLLLLGQGPERDALSATADRLGVSDRVLMPGFLQNPFPAVRNATAYILPSNGEGLPTGIIEALVLGTPVISTNCKTGPSEILDEQVSLSVNGVTQARYGVLVPTEDRPAMTEAIDRLVDPDHLRSLRERAARGAGPYSMDGPVHAYWRQIEEVLK